MRLTVTQRLALAFSLLLLASSGVSAWLQIRSNHLREEEVIQSLSRGLAAHIARSTELMSQGRLRPDAVRRLFGRMMAVNPSVELYLLDSRGRITGDDAPPGKVKRQRVDLAPLRRFLAGARLPIVGDDPRSLHGRKVFSAAQLAGAGGAPAGYIYVILQGQTREALDAHALAGAERRNTLRSMALVAALGLAAGLLAFGWITRPLRRLADALGSFDVGGSPQQLEQLAGRVAPQRGGAADGARAKDEIAVLQAAFAQMAGRIAEQWRALALTEQQRREFVANVSHDLRTPLTSLHGYLEILSLKGDALDPEQRRRYLATALAQSAKVGRLAQSLFELARLEHGHVTAQWEDFAIADLVQDVFQKFELAARAKHITLEVDMPERPPRVRADLAMIERVLTNLLDNAIRHTPQGGTVRVELAQREGQVAVSVCDSGPGVPAHLQESLFRHALGSEQPDRGGLGLLIVRRMLELQHTDIALRQRPGMGAVFEFVLQAAA